MIESENLQNLRQKASDLYAENNVIIAQADAERRPLSDGERQDIEKNNAVFDSLVCKIEAGERGERLNAPQARPITDLPARGGRGAFNSLGELPRRGPQRRRSPAVVDPQARGRESAVTTYGNESTRAGRRVQPFPAPSALGHLAGNRRPARSRSSASSSRSRARGTFAHRAGGRVDTRTARAAWPRTGYAEGGDHDRHEAGDSSCGTFSAPQGGGARSTCRTKLTEDSPQMAQHVQGELRGRTTGSRRGSTRLIVAGDGVGEPLGSPVQAPGAVTVRQRERRRSPADRPPEHGLAELPPGSLLATRSGSSIPPRCPTSAASRSARCRSSSPTSRRAHYGKILGRPIFVSEYCKSWNEAAGDINLVSPDGLITAGAEGWRRPDGVVAQLRILLGPPEFQDHGEDLPRPWCRHGPRRGERSRSSHREARREGRSAMSTFKENLAILEPGIIRSR